MTKIDGSGRMSQIFQSIPGNLTKNVSRYYLPEGVEKDRRTEEALAELDSSMIVNFCYAATDPSSGFALHKDSKVFKLFMGDTGLFVTASISDSKVCDEKLYAKLLSDKASLDLGYVYENAVAQMLRAAGHTLYYTIFHKPDNKGYYEIDFLLSASDKIIPIEVKSGGYDSHTSLNRFMEKYSSRIKEPVVLSTKDLRRKSGILYLPAYMAPWL